MTTLKVDIKIFDSLFAKRPEILRENLEQDLERYYLPYAQKLIALKNQKSPNDGFLVGVSAIQGAGKTTQGEILEILLDYLGHSTDSLSIDDHYITHQQLCALRQVDPRFIRRGVTHDIDLAARDLKKMQSMDQGEAILISGYDKGIQSGDGDRLRWINLTEGLIVKAKVIEEDLTINKILQKVRALQLVSASIEGKNLILLDGMGSDLPLVEPFLPNQLIDFLQYQTGEVEIGLAGGKIHFKAQAEMMVEKEDLPNGWRVVTKKPDFIFYDGWMVGARSVFDDSVFEKGLPALETPEDIQFAKDINKKLLDYEKLWNLLEFINVLYVVNYQKSLEWRDQAEEHLRQKGEGMSKEEIVDFVHYFWRSVHPAIQIKNLACDSEHTNQVVIINNDHSVGEILTPEQVKQKYP